MNVASGKSADWAALFQRLWNRFGIPVRRTRPPYKDGADRIAESTLTFKALIVPEDFRPTMMVLEVGFQNAGDPGPTFVLVRPEVRFGGDTRTKDKFTFHGTHWICTEVDTFEFGESVGVACKRLRVMRESLE